MRLLRAVLLLPVILAAQNGPGDVPGFDCNDCHSSRGWDAPDFSNFDHGSTTFPLEGIHRMADCADCHTGNSVAAGHRFQDASSTCSSCHVDVHQARQSEACQDCHTTRGWIVTEREFNHDQTRFALRGVHAGVQCGACHADLGSLDQTPLDCWNCHQDAYSAATPNHASMVLSRSCTECHDTRGSGWIPAEFDHATMTDWLLTGKHTSTTCESCHTSDVRDARQDCFSCHAQDYAATGTPTFPSAPVHDAPVFYQDCSLCHTTVTWRGAGFDHALTDFPLLGRHASTECAQCHVSNDWEPPATCEGCHFPGAVATTNYQSAELDHESHNIASACELCHTEISWEQSVFDHVAFEAEACESCHLVDHTVSNEPPHGNGNIGTVCVTCHVTDSWEIASFAHTTQQTRFALLGLHLPLDCDACHESGVFNGTPNTCESSGCHLDTYASTTDPDHAVSWYPVNLCTNCHTEAGWVPDIFDHQTTENCVTCHLPDYTGATDPVHVESMGFTQDCAACHSSTESWEAATFSHTGIVDDCQSCHSDDYNAASNPNHSQLGYPQTCKLCHTSTMTWEQTSFSHSFPIAPAGHQNETFETCNSCHPESNTESFTCFGGGCHSIAGMVNEHCEDGGTDCESCNGFTFPGASVIPDNCLTCHPNGDEDDCESRSRLAPPDRRRFWKAR